MPEFAPKRHKPETPRKDRRDKPDQTGLGDLESPFHRGLEWRPPRRDTHSESSSSKSGGNPSFIIGTGHSIPANLKLGNGPGIISRKPSGPDENPAADSPTNLGTPGKVIYRMPWETEEKSSGSSFPYQGYDPAENWQTAHSPSSPGLQLKLGDPPGTEAESPSEDISFEEEGVTPTGGGQATGGESSVSSDTQGQIPADLPSEGSDGTVPEETALDPNEILWEKSDSNLGKWNNTGYRFYKRDGGKLDSGQVYAFIRDQKLAGNVEFRQDFRWKEVGESGATFSIENSKYRYYAYEYKKAEEADFVGENLNKPGQVSAELGIRLHSSPSPDDKEFKTGRGIAAKIYPKGTALRVLAAGNAENEGWYLIRTFDGQQGWIENYFITTEFKSGQDPNTLTVYKVKQGDTLEKILVDHYYESYNIRIGNDLRTIAQALSILNQGNPGVYYSESGGGSFWKDSLLDASMSETRAIYSSIRVKYGFDIRLPSFQYINQLRDAGLVGSRAAWKDAVIEFGRGAEGLLVGLWEGFSQGLTEMVTGLWDTIKGIFTGELWGQFVELWEFFSNASWKDLKDIFWGAASDFASKWNHKGVYEKWRFRGEIVGRILVEILAAVFTGAVALAAKAGKLGKLGKVLNALPKLKANLKSSVVNKFKGRKIDNDALGEVFDGVPGRQGDLGPEGRQDVDLADIKKAESPELSQARKNMPDEARDFETAGLKNKEGRDFDTEARNDLDKELEKPENENQRKYRKNKMAALATAKAIEAGADISNLPIETAMKLFEFLTAVKGVERFEYSSHGGGKFTIYMIGTKIKVDDYNTKEKDEGIPGLSENGRIKPIPLTPDELKNVKIWSGRWTKYIQKWAGKNFTQLPVETQNLLWGKADNSIKKNLTPDDLAAVIKESRGVQIPNSKTGSFYDHLEEFEGAKNSIVKTIGDERSGISGRLLELEREGNAGSFEYRVLSEKRKDLNGILQSYKEMQQK